MSSSACSSIAATFGSARSSWETASPRRRRASSPDSARKIGRIKAASSPCWSLRACPRQSLRKCTVQRCHGAPRTCSSAVFRPGWASEIASCTPTRPPLDQRAQELAPERLRLCLADVQANDLAAAGLMHRVRDHHTLARDPAAVTNLLDLRVDEQIRVAALKRAGAERLDLLIQPSADPRHLAARDAQPQRPHQLVNAPRGDTAHIRLLHDRHQRLLRALARLQKRREIAALPELRDLQLNLPSPRVPPPRPIPVAMRRPIIRPALPELPAHQLADLTPDE